MVYIHLNPDLLQQTQQHLSKDQLILCSGEYYMPYVEFKKLAMKYDMELHKYVKRMDIITNSEMSRFIEISKQTPQQKRILQELKNKHQRRIIQQINPKSSSNYYFENQPLTGATEIKEMTNSISFSMTFIFSFFMAGLTGYYFGNYFLSLDFAKSLMLSAAFIILTIILETTLFIIKQTKNQPKSQGKKVYRDKYDQQYIGTEGKKQKQKNKVD